MKLLLTSMFLLIALLVLLLLLAGCGPAVRYTWEHAQGLGPAEMQRDTEICNIMAREEMIYRRYYDGSPYYGYSWYRYPAFPYRHDGLYPSPYGYAPWYWYPPPHFSYLDARDQLFRFCMRAKGWTLVAQEEEEQEVLKPEPKAE